jgi:hypothetical protein
MPGEVLGCKPYFALSSSDGWLVPFLKHGACPLPDTAWNHARSTPPRLKRLTRNRQISSSHRQGSKTSSAAPLTPGSAAFLFHEVDYGAEHGSDGEQHSP